MTVTWKVFSQRYVTIVAGACAALELRVPSVTPAARAPIHFPYAKLASVRRLDPIQCPVTRGMASVTACLELPGGSVTGVSREPMTFHTAKGPAVFAIQLGPLTPAWVIVSASSMLQVLHVVSANHYIGIWPKKTPVDAQSASAMKQGH